MCDSKVRIRKKIRILLKKGLDRQKSRNFAYCGQKIILDRKL